MRSALLVVGLVAAGLAGCSGPPDAAGAVISGFHAKFDTLQHTADGPVKGTLTLDLSGPVDIADRDLSIHQAYRYNVIWDQLRYEGPEWVAMDPLAVDYYVDGAFRIVRLEQPEVAGSNGALRHASWDAQGAPAPFGLGLQAIGAAPDYLVQGRPQTVDLHKESWLEVRGFTALPQDEFLRFGQRYQYSSPADLVPVRFESREAAGLVTGERSWFVPGEPLPAIRPWALMRYDAPAEARSDWRIFPAEWEDHTGVGIGVAQMVAELVRQKPEAGPLVQAGCLKWAHVGYGGGGGGFPVPFTGYSFLGASELALNLAFEADGGSWNTYRVRYRTEGAGQASWTVTEDDGPRWRTDSTCASRGFDAPRTMLEAMQEGWRLPIPESGVPCGARQNVQAVQVPNGTEAQGAALAIDLAFPDEQHPNDPRWASRSMGHLVWDEEAGAWDELLLQHRDMQRLDAGGWNERPLPRQDPLQVEPRVHCLVPEPAEFP